MGYILFFFSFSTYKSPAIMHDFKEGRVTAVGTRKRETPLDLSPHPSVRPICIRLDAKHSDFVENLFLKCANECAK